MRVLVLCLILALVGAAGAPVASQVVVNEFLAAPGTDWNDDGAFSAQEDEWVELVNVGATTVDAGEYLLSDDGGLANLRAGFSGPLAPGEHLFVTGEMAANWESVNGFSAVGLSLNNSGDTIRLFHVAGGTTTLVDSLPYGSGDVATDVSVGRLPDGTGPLVAFDALTEGGTGAQPTPGGANGGPAAPKILTFSVQPGYPTAADPITIRVLAGDTDGIVEALAFVTTNGGASVAQALALVAGSAERGTWELVLPAQAAGTELALYAQVSDGTLLGLSGTAIVQVTAGSSPVVLNEALADPPPDLAGDANGDGIRDNSDDEFIEIHNRGTAAVSLAGWTLADASGVRHEFAADRVVAPGTFLTVFGGGTPTGIPGPVTVASTGGLSLNNTGDTVRLADAGGVVCDVLEYGAEANADQSLIRYPDGDGEWLRPLDLGFGWAYSPGLSNCPPSAVSERSWGAIKALYRE